MTATIRNGLLGFVLAGISAACGAQGAWSPQKNVEIVVGSAPGGSNDRTARQVEKIMVEQKLLPTSLTVVNRPGAGGIMALTYVTQHAGEPHYLLVYPSSMLAAHITGQSKLNYTDFTPIASLFNDYVLFVVNAASPIKTGKDLIERLKKDPQSISIGFANVLGSQNHIAAGMLIKAVGGEPRNLKVVAYKGASEAVVNLLGGHLDLVTTAAGNVAEHISTGKLRLIGVAAPQRYTGMLSSVPTWKEQGVNVVFGGGRAVMGPKGLSAPQITYWEGALRKVTQAAEWRDAIAQNHWTEGFVTGAQLGKDIQREYTDMKSALVDLGFAKQ